MVQKYTIGRNPGNNIVYAHPAVSGSHAELVVNDSMGIPQYVFIDHSTNGTYVNGQLLHNSSCYVAYNDQIILAGQVLFDWNAISSANFMVPHSATMMQTPGAANPAYQQANALSPGYQQAGPYGAYAMRSKDITFTGALRNFFANYVDFKGRATRKEYWLTALWLFIFSVALELMAIPFTINSIDIFDLYDIYDVFDLFSGLSSLSWYLYIVAIYNIVIFLPSLSLLVRRIHDTGKDGLWILMLLVPIANIVFFCIWVFSASDPKPNKWGR